MQAIKVGSTVKGSTFYGKMNTLTGEVIEIDGSIATVKWDDGQTAKFYLGDFYKKGYL